MNGCTVPHIELLKPGGVSEGFEFDYTLLIDGRFAALVKTDELLNQWGYALANAMAVAAGYTHHGPESKPRNRFATLAIEIEDS